MNTYRLLVLNVAIATVAAVIQDVPWQREKCQVELFDACGSAAWATLELGEYSNQELLAKGFQDNKLSGIAIIGDESCYVELFDDPNDEGEDRFRQVEGGQPRKVGPMVRFYKGHSRYALRNSENGDLDFSSDNNMDSIFSDGKCHEYGKSPNGVTSAAFYDYTDKTSSIRVGWRNAKKADQQTFWPSIARDEFKDDFDATWGEEQCLCDHTPEKNICEEAYSDREPRCEKYADLLSQRACEAYDFAYDGNTTRSVRKSQTCGWKQKCVEFSDQPTMNTCIDHDKHFCALRRFLGGSSSVTDKDEANPVVWYQECKKDETCCDAQCCTKDEVCVEMQSSSYEKNSGSRGGVDPTLLTIGGSGARFYYDFILYDLEAVEVNGWKMPGDEEFKNRPMMCQTKFPKVDNLFATRLVYRPILVLNFIIVLLVLSVLQQGCLKTFAQTQNSRPLWLLLFCMFLVFSPLLNYTIFFAIVACATILWPHDKKQFHWLALGQFLVLWIALGGNNLLLGGVDGEGSGIVGYENSEHEHGPSANILTTDQHANLDEIIYRCRWYYIGQFEARLNPAMRSFVEEVSWDDEKSWGLCHPMWVTATYYFAQSAMMMLAWMFMISLWNILIPTPEPPLWCCCKKKGDAEPPAKQRSVEVKPAPAEEKTEEKPAPAEEKPAPAEEKPAPAEETDDVQTDDVQTEEFKKDDV